ncbi:MAG TPA: prepilin-type N-terminal cleavage/methylation domain-containing protein [Thermoanaerobaculia bacterium]|nr:prepilin-type N-terminal cleavage/methylation domain-containing protein [Thermoanaerobaculia bacterium]
MKQRGFTMAELITVVGIIAVLSAVALPMVRFAYRRDKERDLQYRLHRITDAIDRYSNYRTRNLLKDPPALKAGDYPKDLDTLTKAVELLDGKKIVLLRERDLIDPMTGKADFRTISSSDDKDSASTNGDNVYDVRSTSTALALDGHTHYNEW